MRARARSLRNPENTATRISTVLNWKKKLAAGRASGRKHRPTSPFRAGTRQTNTTNTLPENRRRSPFDGVLQLSATHPVYIDKSAPSLIIIRGITFTASFNPKLPQAPEFSPRARFICHPGRARERRAKVTTFYKSSSSSASR